MAASSVSLSQAFLSGSTTQQHSDRLVVPGFKLTSLPTTQTRLLRPSLSRAFTPANNRFGSRAATVRSELQTLGNKNDTAFALVDKSVNTIRFLAVDAVEKANSGHPGLPMGFAPVGHVLYDEAMRYNPKNPYWFNRDRFVLSAGHGCMLQYALLHLAGYDSVKVLYISLSLSLSLSLYLVVCCLSLSLF
ncbi:hypothetical protein CsSME_00001516 [Camellia sinensis var. sinensis]